jgi:hypothetical protein
MVRRTPADPHRPVTRLGWPDPERVPWQGDPKWGSSPYGHGGKTIHQWGCPAACLAPLLRLCGFSAGATPQTVVARAMREDPPVWAASRSKAYLPRLARSTGLSCPDAPTVVTSAAFTGIPVEEMSMLITAHLDALAGFAWLQVDHTDDGVGDHWIGAFAAQALAALGRDLHRDLPVIKLAAHPLHPAHALGEVHPHRRARLRDP